MRVGLALGFLLGFSAAALWRWVVAVLADRRSSWLPVTTERRQMMNREGMR